MSERQTVGMQSNGMILEGYRVSVFDITNDGMTHGRQLSPDLMRPA
ncbi:MAG: hypothetical protein RLZZ617_744, partial [Bacteroidota bacterium]